MTYRVRRMREDDLAGGLRLSTDAGWNQRIEDWRWMARAAGPRAFVAESSGGGVAGTCMGLDYGSFGWIAMMLVDPSRRRQGVGRSLLDAAIATLPPDNPIGLDATPAGRPLYESREFVQTCTLTRHVRPGGTSFDARGDVSGAKPTLLPITASDLESLTAIDARVFGAPRSAVLKWGLEQAPHLCWVARDGDGRVIGYCLGRRGRLFDQIGPVVATSPELAIVLAGRACASHDRDRALVIDVFDRHAALGEWMTTRGFDAQRPLYRMWRHSKSPVRPESSELPGLREYAIFGPDVA